MHRTHELLRRVLIKLDRQAVTLVRLEDMIVALTKLEMKVAGELDDLRREVEEDGTAVASAVTLLEGLKAKLDEAIASGNMQAVKELSDQLSSNTDRLAAAVVANTPAAPTP